MKVDLMAVMGLTVVLCDLPRDALNQERQSLAISGTLE